jgi:hypothetical protein
MFYVVLFYDAVPPVEITSYLMLYNSYIKSYESGNFWQGAFVACLMELSLRPFGKAAEIQG